MLIRLSLLASLFVFSSTASADEIVLRPGSSVDLVVHVPTRVTCEGNDPSRPRCELTKNVSGYDHHYYFIKAGSNLYWSCADCSLEEATKNFKMLRDAGICP